MTGPWRGSSRQVWCQRSDGLNVTGKWDKPAGSLYEYVAICVNNMTYDMTYALDNTMLDPTP